jgi:hypothetical protein
MNRRKATVLSGALGAAALTAATLFVVVGTRAAILLAIVAFATFVYHVWRALRFAGVHPRLFARHAR